MESTTVSKNKRYSDIAVLFLIIGLVIFFLTFIAELTGKSDNIDKFILLSLRETNNTAVPIGPDWLLIFMKDVSSIGSVSILTLLTLLISGYLIIDKKLKLFRLILFAVLGGCFVELLIKSIFSRQRPEIVPHLIEVNSWSFPSGHSVMSAAVFLSLTAIIFQFNIKQSAKIYFLVFAIILVLLVGISRIYLGVHYPSDVAGGWALGLVWSSLTALLAHSHKDTLI
jgi:undecaprenyl-diphosphatase